MEQVAVTGDDVDGETSLVAGDERADHIVGLEAGSAQAGNPQCGQGIPDQGYLWGEVVGALLLDIAALSEAVRLVGRDEVDPPLRTPVVVPAGDEFGGAMGVDQGGDHVEEPSDRVGRWLVGRLPLVRHAVEGAEVEGGGVEEKHPG